MEQVFYYILHGAYSARWTSREWREFIEGEYVRLALAIHQGCDTVVVRPGGILLFREGRLAEPFPMRLIDPALLRIDKRDMMRIIRRLDPLIYRHFRLVHRDQDGTTYRLTPSGEPPADPVTAELDRRDATEASINRLLDLAHPRAEHPRESWGLRASSVAPYDLGTLLRANGTSEEPVIAHGVARGLTWTTRAEPTIARGIAEAQLESRTSGLPPDEQLERAQAQLEAAQAAVEAGATTPLWRGHSEPIRPGAARRFIYLRVGNEPPGVYRLLFDWLYDALVAEGDELRLFRQTAGTTVRGAEVLIVRAGTVMAVINAGYVSRA